MDWTRWKLSRTKKLAAPPLRNNRTCKRDCVRGSDPLGRRCGRLQRPRRNRQGPGELPDGLGRRRNRRTVRYGVLYDARVVAQSVMPARAGISFYKKHPVTKVAGCFLRYAIEWITDCLEFSAFPQGWWLSGVAENASGCPWPEKFHRSCSSPWRPRKKTHLSDRENRQREFQR